MNFGLFCGRVSGRGSSSLPAAASSPFPSLRSGTRAWRLATSAFARHRLATATAATAATAARTASTSTLERYFYHLTRPRPRLRPPRTLLPVHLGGRHRPRTPTLVTSYRRRLTRAMNWLPVSPSELTRDEFSGRLTLRLPGTDPRAIHLRSVLRASSGDTIQVVVLHHARTTGTYHIPGERDHILLTLNEDILRPVNLTITTSTTATTTKPKTKTTPESTSTTLPLSPQYSPPAPMVDVILALPRPKALRRILTDLTIAGVRRLILVGGEKVERSYWTSAVLAPEAVREAVVGGLAQAGDWRVPHVVTCPHLGAALRIVRGEGEGTWGWQELVVGTSMSASTSGAGAGGTAGVLQCPAPEVYMVAHPEGRILRSADGCGDGEIMHARLRAVGEAGAGCGSVAVAIGPEGGWSAGEMERFDEGGWERVTLGPRVLTTGVAVVSVVAVLSSHVSNHLVGETRRERSTSRGLPE